jgi:hypothetical protein
LAVVVNEFEVVPEPREARAQPAAASAPAAPRPADVRRQVEGALRTMVARHLRLRAS